MTIGNVEPTAPSGDGGDDHRPANEGAPAPNEVHATDPSASVDVPVQNLGLIGFGCLMVGVMLVLCGKETFMSRIACGACIAIGAATLSTSFSGLIRLNLPWLKATGPFAVFAFVFWVFWNGEDGDVPPVDFEPLDEVEATRAPTSADDEPASLPRPHQGPSPVVRPHASSATAPRLPPPLPEEASNG